MIHHNHIEFFPKEVYDEWPLGGNIMAPPNCMNKLHS
jgi:hypothetical protein